MSPLPPVTSARSGLFAGVCAMTAFLHDRGGRTNAGPAAGTQQALRYRRHRIRARIVDRIKRSGGDLHDCRAALGSRGWRVRSETRIASCCRHRATVPRARRGVERSSTRALQLHRADETSRPGAATCRRAARAAAMRPSPAPYSHGARRAVRRRCQRIVGATVERDEVNPLVVPIDDGVSDTSSRDAESGAANAAWSACGFWLVVAPFASTGRNGRRRPALP